MFFWLGILFILAAVALLSGAVFAFFKGRSLESRVKATGMVVELVSRITTSGRANIICPVVEFTTSSGEKIRFTSDFGSLPARHTVGQSVNVGYDPADPQRAEIDSPANRMLAPFILGFMGVLACCLGTVFLAVFLLARTPIAQ